jgi:hypothetical protein
MKTKIIVTILCGMLLTTGTVLAIPSETMKTTTVGTRQVSPTSTDVPVWHVNDFWTYKVDNISVNYQQNNQTIYLTLSMDQLPLTVTSDSGDTYLLSFSTTASGHGIIDVVSDQGPINMILDFTDVQLTGSVRIDKTQLGIQSIEATLRGLFRLNIIEQPFVPFQIHHLPIPITVNVSIGCSTPISILSFPMDTGMTYGLQATNITINGEVHSIWLNIIHFANMIMGFFGRPFLSEEIDALLPVLNIKEALTAFGMGNIFSIPEVPDIFTTGGTMETLSVPEGTYEVYNISVADGIGSVFYAPAAGNVVKISGNFQDLIPYIQNLKMELIDTNYQG